MLLCIMGHKNSPEIWAPQLPSKLTANIAKLYKNSKVKIKVGKRETLVDYTTGVHQGDNMSPVLFLFIMQAFLDTLRIDA
jgi:hypothetical protein